jgi:hypothetical protein
MTFSWSGVSIMTAECDGADVIGGVNTVGLSGDQDLLWITENIAGVEKSAGKSG